jgi:xylulokinase
MYSLGIEFSTQSAKIIVLDLDSKSALYSDFFEYDAMFPVYATKGGVLAADNPQLRHTSPAMMLDSLDEVFLRLAKSGIDLSRVGSVKADAMQHCSVYVSDGFVNALGRLSDDKSCLAAQLSGFFTRPTSPIWEDRTTSDQADFLEKSLSARGGAAACTANRAELRFPAAQIMKWCREDQGALNRTARVYLLSAFVTAVLSASDAPVDTGDGWGTNLNSIDIDSPGWSGHAMEAADSYMAAQGALKKTVEIIGGMCHYDDLIGHINPYFANKYGVNPNAAVLAGTGDNPATLLGCGGRAVISLGSSYTVNGVMERVIPSPNGEYNVFGFTKGRAMALSVITNGSKLHELFLRRYLGLASDEQLNGGRWKAYMDLAGPRAISGNEKLMLPYYFDESVPQRTRGVVREGFGEDDAAANVRALHLSQVLSLKLHSGHLAVQDSLCLVGGGSKNMLLKMLLADAFGSSVYSIKNASFAAPLGCAISGARHLLGCSYDEAASIFVETDGATLVKPDGSNAEKIRALLARYREFEQSR